MNTDKLSDPNYIVIITPFEEEVPVADAGVEISPGAEEELHAKPIIWLKEKVLPTANACEFMKLKEGWEKLNKQTRELLESTEKDLPKGIKLDEISFLFGISAKGNIGLVSAGANASITMKFKRK